MSWGKTKKGKFKEDVFDNRSRGELNSENGGVGGQGGKGNCDLGCMDQHKSNDSEDVGRSCTDEEIPMGNQIGLGNRPEMGRGINMSLMTLFQRS